MYCRMLHFVLQVLSLAPGAVVLATSPTTPYELWCLGSNVLASQFHQPVLTPPFMLQVLTLPPGAVVLATSPTAPYELWCLGNNVLASQFHLEFDEPLVIDKIWTRLTSIGRLNSEQSADSKKALEAGGQHNVQMLQVNILGSCGHTGQLDALPGGGDG